MQPKKANDHDMHAKQKSAHDFKYRVTILGQASTGKSSITMRYLFNTFSPEYDPTLQDEYIKTFQEGDQIGCLGKAQSSFLEILDTAGDP